MNPNSYRYYLKLTQSLYNTHTVISNNHLFASAKIYGNYGRYLVFNWFPRLAFHESYSEAYTPKSMKYNAYIVYGLILSSFVMEMAYLKSNAVDLRKRRIELLN